MKAYNEQWIYNRSIVEQAERWHRQGLLSDDQVTRVQKEYPVEFRQTNGFIEIGLFLFTTVAILACYMLPASVFWNDIKSKYGYAIFNIVAGIGTGIIGQLLINRRLLYRNGIDNAFAATLAGFLAFGLNQLLPEEWSVATHCFATLPLLLLILWYYGDTLIAFFTLAVFYSALFDSLLKYDWGKDAMPFIMMAVSGGLYLTVRQYFRRYPKETYYVDPLNLAQWIALIMLAASSNYFVIRELNGLLLGPQLRNSGLVGAPEISLSSLFWILTFLIPGIYLGEGLKKRNRMLIILGTMGLIAAVVTLHEYVALVPLNVALTIGGLILIGIAVAGIRYLQKPKHGFTDAPDEDSPNEFLTNVATVAAVHATGVAQQSPKNDLRFGGGNFGGGGSEGKY
ncbi:hypothetical protein IC229_13920 [Spirosoma sp. BT702]|uniref:DUF2157 domain-containing protein n=1 Tax=Spirosoma profusum TaxID=2771354 RepID=A0A927AR37_9BACT|nr:hypothetical protein [Spirosoma profusum]MBD2701743.1 hypothetical protein [Spirosoma profusum]